MCSSSDFHLYHSEHTLLLSNKYELNRFTHSKIYTSPTFTNLLMSRLRKLYIGRSYSGISSQLSALELIETLPKYSYITGGSVRDLLSGSTPNDIDILADLSERTLLNLAKKWHSQNVYHSFESKHTVKYNMKRFVTWKNKPHTLRYLKLGKLKPSTSQKLTQIEIQRIYHYSMERPSRNCTPICQRHFGFDPVSSHQFFDFTCNALLYDIKRKILIDLSGRGLKDALSKKLYPFMPFRTHLQKLDWLHTPRPYNCLYRYLYLLSKGYKGSKQLNQFIFSKLHRLIETSTVF